MMSVPAVKSSSVCAKCTTNKVGKRTCCARGGAWFKNCGDIGDTQFDHTWAEGIKACNDVVISLSAESPPRFNIYMQNTTHLRNTTQQQTNSPRAGSMSSAGVADSEVCIGVAKVVVCICVLIISSHL